MRSSRKSVESFISKVCTLNPSKYNQIKQQIFDYKDKNCDAYDTLKSIVNIISEENHLIEDLNKLLHSDLQIPLKQTKILISSSKNSQKILDIFLFLQKEHREKMILITKYLENMENFQSDKNIIIKLFFFFFTFYKIFRIKKFICSHLYLFEKKKKF